MDTRTWTGKILLLDFNKKKFKEFRRPCGLSPDVEEKFVGDLNPF